MCVLNDDDDDDDDDDEFCKVVMKFPVGNYLHFT